MVSYKNLNNADFAVQESSKHIVIKSLTTIYQQNTEFSAIYPVVLCRSVCTMEKNLSEEYKMLTMRAIRGWAHKLLFHISL